MQDLVPGRWNVFCGSYNAGTHKVIIMLNGVLSKVSLPSTWPPFLAQDSVDPSMSLAMANTSLALQEVLASLRLGGSIPYGGSLYQSPFSGLLTDLNIWSRALDREDMQQLQEECRYPASGLPHLESHYRREAAG